MNFVGIDTNVLIYAFDTVGDPRKHEIAIAQVLRAGQNGSGLLALQVLMEFYAVAVRKNAARAPEASTFIDAWTKVFPITTANLQDVDRAMQMNQEHNIAFWDAMLLATYQRAGARALLSEDLQDDREIDGLRIINPFSAANTARLNEILPRV